MSWFTKLFAGSVDKIVDSVGNAIDKIVTSDEERLQLGNELVRIKQQSELAKKELEMQYEKELTKRQELDMKSDSWLSKNIRPLAFIFMLGITTLFTFTDGNIEWTFEDGSKYEFEVKAPWQDLWTSLTIVFAGFYAGGRSLEKMTKIKNQDKEST